MTPEEKIAHCEQAIGHSFQNKLLCLEALQMSDQPLLWDGRLEVVNKNERLTVLGNTALRFHLCKTWYDSRRTKGQWSLAEQELLKTDNLAQIGSEKGLGRCIFASSGLKEVSKRMVAATLEALIGAASCDGGEEASMKAIAILGMTHVNLS